jgi:hypothetical protein
MLNRLDGWKIAVLVFLVMLPLLSIFGGIGLAALLWLTLVAAIVIALAVVLNRRIKHT